VPSLQALLASEHEVVAVLTRADAPSGRGKKLTPSAVKVAAEAAGIPVITGNPSEGATQAAIKALNCETAAVVAYGHLLRPAVLELMPKGWFNLHFSLLPRWRGAAPVQWALISGDSEVGVTVFQLDAGMDTGPIFAAQQIELHPEDSAETLLPRMAEQGANLLVKVFDDLAAGVAVGVPQIDEGTMAPKLSTERARVDWRGSNTEITNLIRGVTPAPGAWTTLVNPGAEPLRLGLGPVTPMPMNHAILEPGQLQVEKKQVLVGTAFGPVQLGTVQPPGKKPMLATDWARGARLTPDSRLQ